MINAIKSFFDPSKKAIKKVKPTVDKILEIHEDYKNKSDDELKMVIKDIRAELKALSDAIPEEYKTSIKQPGKSDDYVKKEQELKDTLISHLPAVYAAVREALRRKVGYSHYEVQLTASTILAQGYKLTELKTGEGKTLVFQLPAALYGLTGRGAHVVTVNDYLAKRDGEYAGHILANLDITVGIITPDASYKFIPDEDVPKYKGEESEKAIKEQKIKNPGDCDGLNLIECSKKEAYDCDVVYGTNNEFGFDYLRDNMAMSDEDMAQKEMYFCIVDEADSILIDEARTPLIISAPAAASNELYVKFARLVPRLEEEKHFTLDEKANSVLLTDDGSQKVEDLIGVKNLWQDYKLAHHLENALKAEYLFKKDIHYIVKSGNIYIVDQFTGRVLEGRRYSEGLHQAIEAKEGVEIKRESKTLGTVTFQNFFRLYKILSGGSGTVMTEAEEFYKIYNLESIEVPTNKPIIRKDLNDRVFKNQTAKFNAVADEIIEVNKNGQPILVGTASIEDSEVIARLLEKRGIKHDVLNAKFHEKESKIVANAGKPGSITVATNMAGRGTDIKLGGKNATDEEFEEVAKLGGLAVIGTQRHESRRIDNQLRGRSGRQGEPGMTRFFVALDDDIMRMQGGAIVERVMSMTGIPDDMPIEAGIVGRSIESAQKRVEGMHFDSRKTVVELDDVVNQQREIYYSRRRRILLEIERAIKALEDKDESNDLDNDSINYIKDELKEKLDAEIEFLVSRHFISERKDDVDRVKVIGDYLDLASDDLIGKGLEAVSGNKVQGSVKNELEKFTKDMDQAEMTATLKEIINEPLKIKIEDFGDNLPLVAKVLFLRTMDELWTDHLDEMKALRDGIYLRQYAQQSPIVEYKNEGFAVFNRFIAKIDSEIARRALKIARVRRRTAEEMQNQNVQTNADQVKDINTGTRELQGQLRSALNQGGLKTNVPRIGKQKTKTKTIEIGRNDKVTVEYSDGSVKEDVKFKKVENDVKAGLARIVKKS